MSSLKLAASCALVIAATLAAKPAHAQFGVTWPHTPKIVAIGVEGDPRLSLVEEAVAFWNKTLEAIGSGFRLGRVVHLVGPLPEEALQSLSRSILEGPRPVRVSPALRDLPGDLTILLGESDFVSFAGPFHAFGKRVVGIRGANLPPMNLPNVARNVIAHELGHAIGLGHNVDPAKLMCGRPAPCRPDLFRSDRPVMFPLTAEEKAQLRKMYPADWSPR